MPKISDYRISKCAGHCHQITIPLEYYNHYKFNGQAKLTPVETGLLVEPFDDKFEETSVDIMSALIKLNKSGASTETLAELLKKYLDQN